MLDKEIIRDYLLKQKFSGNGEIPSIPQQKIVALGQVYHEVAKKLLGKEIMIEASCVADRKQIFGVLSN